MADAIHRYVVTIPSVTGLPEDRVENVLSVGQVGALGVNDLQDAATFVQGFYTGTGVGQSDEIGTRLSESLSRVANACTVSVYSSLDLTGATPFGSPVLTQTFTLPASDGGNALPDEVACVVSFHGNLTDVPQEVGNTRPAQRRRGRMYIGPLNNTAGTDLGTQYRPSTTFRNDLAIAFPTMANGINAIGPLYLGVWSKLDAEVWQADAGWIDNAWDTQRRRGLAATLRTQFDIT